MPKLLTYTLKRLAFVPVGAFIIVSLSFFLINLIPSDPASAQLGNYATPEAIATLNHQLGLDRPLMTRYVDYIEGVFLEFDLGRSYYSQREVSDDIVAFLPNTLELVVPALVLASLFGVAVGSIGARFVGRAPDHVSRTVIVVTQAIPDFLIGLLLIYFVFYRLGWAPAPTGRLGLLDIPPPTRTHALMLDSALAGEWGTLKSVLSHSILPIITLALAISSLLAKTTRSLMVRSFDSYQVEFARACGLPERKLWGYAFRAARTPIVTYGVIIFAAMLGGAAIVETVFAWNGIGQFAVDRMQQLDLPEMQGIVLVLGLMTLLVLVVLDLVVAFLDPRVSYE